MALTEAEKALETPSLAVFEADKGGRAPFKPAHASYRPPTCA
jgi:hypothetical protein